MLTSILIESNSSQQPKITGLTDSIKTKNIR